MKQYLFKVYDFPSGDLVGTLSPRKVGEARFSSRINQGQGEIRIDYVVPFDDFDENLIKYMNIVRVTVTDENNPLGRLLYTGWISQIEPFAIGSDQGISVTILGLVSLLQNAYYKNPGFAFTLNDDPGQLFKDLIDNFNTIYAIANTDNFPNGLIHYAAGGIQNTGTTVELDVSEKTWLQCLGDIFATVPEDWFWRIDGDGNTYLQEKPATATHVFTVGGTLERLSFPRNMERVKNKVYIKDKNGAISTFQDAPSQALYGLREKIETVNSDDTNTLNEAGAASLGDNKDPKSEGSIDVNTKYDIESIKVGQTCSIRNLRYGADLIPDNLLIVSIAYSPDSVKLNLEQESRLATELVNLAQQANV